MSTLSPKEQLRRARRRARKRHEKTPQQEQIAKAKREARNRKERMQAKKLCALCRDRGLPCPVREYQFHDTRKWRIDYAWPDHGVALEVEGGVWSGGRHVRGQGYINDCEKYNEVALHGFTLIRVTPDQLFEDQTFEWIERAIEC